MAYDVPPASALNALAAIEAFDDVVKQYAVLLESQSVRLRNQDAIGVQVLSVRGDKLARDVATLGEQLSSYMRILLSGDYAGEVTRDLLEKIEVVSLRAQSVGARANELAQRCMKMKMFAVSELAKYDIIIQDNANGIQVFSPDERSPKTSGYKNAKNSPPLLIDILS